MELRCAALKVEQRRVSGRARQPGLITRLAGCTHEELKHRTNFWVMPTWVTESAINTDGDSCAPRGQQLCS